MASINQVNVLGTVYDIEDASAQQSITAIQGDIAEITTDLGNKAPLIEPTVGPADVATFTDGAAGMPMEVTVALDPIQAGSGDPAPDNVRAISGHSSVGIMTAGKNLLPGDYYNGDHYTVNGITFTVSDGKIVANGTATATAQYNILSRTANSFILPNGRYRLRGSPAGGGSTTWELGVSVTSAGGGTNTIGRDYRNNGEFDYTQSMGRISTYAIIRSGQTVENFTFEPMLTLVADADEPYEKPACATKTVTFPDPPGTVYGGTLTVNRDGTGKLVVDRQFVDLTGKTIRESSQTGIGRFVFQTSQNDLPNAQNAGKYVVCSHFKQVNALTSLSTNVIYVNSRTQILIQTGNSDDTVETFTAYLAEQSAAGTPVTLCYRLETPVTYDLTAEQVGQITSVYGLNNVWSAGQVTVTYAADTKLYIDGKIASLQATILENISNA